MMTAPALSTAGQNEQEEFVSILQGVAVALLHVVDGGYDKAFVLFANLQMSEDVRDGRAIFALEIVAVFVAPHIEHGRKFDVNNHL